MAGYSYKKVMYREDFLAMIPAYEIEAGGTYDGDANYDGDGWGVVSMLLESKDSEIAALNAQISALKTLKLFAALFDIANELDAEDLAYDVT